MFPFLRYGARITGIALTFAAIELLYWRQRRGQKLARTLEKLGPAFIKLGQMLSTRSDLIGERMAEDLGGLRDALPPFPASIARAAVEEAFGRPIIHVFSSFDNAPVAAASIAQVHKATLSGGKPVAVKILRPNIEKAFARDLDLFAWMAEWAQRRWPRLKPVEVVRTLKESVFLELDLRFEAAAACELADNMKSHAVEGFRVPAIDWALTTRRVMVMEWVDGIPLGDIAAVRASGFSSHDIMAKAARSLFTQIFIDGFFHADLHPGNLFLDKNGDLVAVDFGIMGRLDWKSRMYIAEILRGFLTGDYRHVAEVHFTAGYVPPHKSIEAFTQACMAVTRPITGKPLNEISVARLLGQMFSIAAEFEMEVQPQLLLMQKTMMVTEGVGRMLDPHLNMWELARPLIEEWVSGNLGAAGKMKNAARQGRDIARRLPAMLENTCKNLGDAEGIRIHPHSLEALERHRRAQDRQWLALGWAAFSLVILFAAYAIIFR